MESLQERKARAERELREISILEKQHEIRNHEAEKNELVERLILDLKDQPLACAMQLDTVAKVKMVCGGKNAPCETCYFAETCQQIMSLTGKASPVKKSKSNGTGKVKLAEIKMNTKREKGRITYSQEGRVEHSFHVKEGEEWKSFTDRIKAGLQELNYSLSAGQIQGIGHKGKDGCYEKLVMGK